MMPTERANRAARERFGKSTKRGQSRLLPFRQSEKVLVQADPLFPSSRDPTPVWVNLISSGLCNSEERSGVRSLYSTLVRRVAAGVGKSADAARKSACATIGQKM